MQSLFDPVIDSIIRLVNNQIGLALRDHGERIEVGSPAPNPLFVQQQLTS